MRRKTKMETSLSAGLDKLLVNPSLEAEAPHFEENWPGLKATLTTAAENMHGRGKLPTRGAPFLDEDAERIEALRERLGVEWEAFRVATTDVEKSACKKRHHSTKRQLARLKTRARCRYLKHCCRQLEAHLAQNDLGSFYHDLKRLGVHIFGKTKQGQ